MANPTTNAGGIKRTRSLSDAQNLPEAKIQRVESDEESVDEFERQVTAKFDHYRSLLHGHGDEGKVDHDATFDDGLLDQLEGVCALLVEWAPKRDKPDKPYTNDELAGISSVVSGLVHYGEGEAALALLNETGVTELKLTPGIYPFAPQLAALEIVMSKANVVSVELDATHSIDQIAALGAVLGEGKFLKELVLSAAEISVADVEALAPLLKDGSLEVLKIGVTKATEAVVTVLAQAVAKNKCLKHIRLPVISMSSTWIEANVLKHLEGHEHLESITLRQNWKADDWKDKLRQPLMILQFSAKCPALKSLSWTNLKVFDNGRAFIDFMNANPLAGKDGEQQLLELAKGCKLKKLAMSFFALPPFSAAALCGQLALNGHLVSLDLGGTHLPIQAIKALADNQLPGGTLKHINLIIYESLSSDIPQRSSFICSNGKLHHFEDDEFVLDEDVALSVQNEFENGGWNDFAQKAPWIFQQQSAAMEMAENQFIRDGAANVLAAMFRGLAVSPGGSGAANPQPAAAGQVDETKQFCLSALSEMFVGKLFLEGGTDLITSTTTMGAAGKVKEIEKEAEKIEMKHLGDWSLLGQARPAFISRGSAPPHAVGPDEGMDVDVEQEMPLNMPSMMQLPIETQMAIYRDNLGEFFAATHDMNLDMDLAFTQSVIDFAINAGASNLLRHLYANLTEAFGVDQLNRMLARGMTSELNLDWEMMAWGQRAQGESAQTGSANSGGWSGAGFGAFDSNSSSSSSSYSGSFNSNNNSSTNNPSSSSSMSPELHPHGAAPSAQAGPPTIQQPLPDTGQLLQAALGNDNPILMALAVTTGLDVNPVNAGGANPLLQQAVMAGPRVVKCLLDRGAQDPHGAALNAAKRRLKANPQDTGMQEIVNLLQAHGAQKL